MSKKPKTIFTGEAVEATTLALARSASAMTSAETAFEADPSPANWAAAQEARAEHVYQTRVNELAVSAHVAAEKVRTEKAEAEAEAARLERLASVEKDIASNVAASIVAGEALISGLARSWELAVAAQSVGSTKPNPWQYEVREALARCCAAVGLPPRAIHV